MLKKLILATAGLAVTVPALADNGYHRGHYKRVVVQERYVVQRPVVVQHYYRPAPRPVYVVHRAPPPPVYVVHPARVDPVPVIFGAIVGAAVVHSVLSH